MWQLPSLQRDAALDVDRGEGSFTDTDHDEDQFLVRRADFTGTDKPYEQLERSLDADIYEARENLYSCVSRPLQATSTSTSPSK